MLRQIGKELFFVWLNIIFLIKPVKRSQAIKLKWRKILFMQEKKNQNHHKKFVYSKILIQTNVWDRWRFLNSCTLPETSACGRHHVILLRFLPLGRAGKIFDVNYPQCNYMLICMLLIIVTYIQMQKFFQIMPWGLFRL